MAMLKAFCSRIPMGNFYQLLFLLYFVCVGIVISMGYVNPTPYTNSYLFALPPIIGYIGGIAVRSSTSSHHKHHQNTEPHHIQTKHRINHHDDPTIMIDIEKINKELGCVKCDSRGNYIHDANKSRSRNQRKGNPHEDYHSSISSSQGQGGQGGGNEPDNGEHTNVLSELEKEINEFYTNPSDSLNYHIPEEELVAEQKENETATFVWPTQDVQYTTTTTKDNSNKQDGKKKNNSLQQQQQQKKQQEEEEEFNYNLFTLKDSKPTPETRILRNEAAIYRDFNQHQPREYYDYESLNIKWNPVDKYELITKIGRGKYSEVFHGVNLKDESDVVIKILKPIQKFKIQREVRILQALDGGPNIIPLIDTIRDPQTRISSFVFPLVNKTDLRELINDLEDMDVRFYMYELLRAIQYTHSKGIMHRDIKPLNVAIDHSKRKLVLLDWGLAEFYHPLKNYNVRVASRHYKPPELLTDMHDYHYSLDMWSFGCLFAGMILDRDPFFNGEDNDDQLMKITKVLGTEDLYKYLDKYGLFLNDDQQDLIKTRTKKNWERYIPYENEDLAHPAAIDLLDKLLRYDPADRLTATQAMEHPYFYPITKKLRKNNNNKN
ncbi:hypothetical protein CYY_007763 [Polysphondylium violaceum]|uniref:non-specific serine/threonine protein kinase n=1 Tax=Polysphondylium violaceum TaxID=133409 RepID=A0A8J4V4N3_9MYCE|nr:hypothetical protein CYY_007763 [Polysphondylium violaceum]